ncbi:unnamed protein product [Somion occarium]|uniref:Fungal-type protein kinase domain-containing protein n=1 Tax=Somion occarium TaxID=3059160 RepID=A0ABP1CUH8_9APHY
MGLFNPLLFHNYLRGDCHHSNTCHSHFYSLALDTDFDTDFDIIMDDATVPQDVEMHDEARDTVAPLDETKNKIKNQRRLPGREVASVQVPQTTAATAVPGFRNAISLPLQSQMTPLKPSLSAIEMDDGVCDPELKAFIQTEFKKNVIRDYPIIDFIDRAWHTTPSQIPPGDYALAQEQCKDYLGAARYSKMSKLRKLGEDGPPLIGLAERAETRACVAFQALFEKLAALVLDRWKEEDAEAAAEMERTRFQGTLRFLNEKIVKGNYANIKPDFGYVTENGENVDAISWDAFGLFGELKKADGISGLTGPPKVDKSLLDPEREELYKPPPIRKSRKRSKPDSPVEEGPSSKQRRDSQSDSVLTRKPKPDEGVPKTPSAAKFTPQETALLQLNEEEEENYSEFTNNEVQAAKYLNELLSHGARNYATGFLVENKKISLWYGDRFGIIKSRLFNFIEEPHYFLLMVTAIFRASDADLGFCPLIRNIPTNHLSYDGATLKVPAAVDISNKAIPGDVEFEVSLTEPESIFTAYGTVGRGTTVVPITAVGPKNCRRFGKERLVAKMSWQPVKRYEEGHIRTIRQTLKKSKNKNARAALAYIVDLKCSSTLAINDPNVNLPRAFMTQLPGMPEDEKRDFRILIMKEYLPLQFIDTADELKKVFRDALTGHHWAWTVACVLHRDISISNVMFHRKRNRVIGVLCDWDLAETKEYLGEEPELAVDRANYESYTRMMQAALGNRNAANISTKAPGPLSRRLNTEPTVNEDEAEAPKDDDDNAHKDEGEEANEDEGDADEDEDDDSARRRKAKYRTGTGPFMAMDLLAPGPAPTHLYRHDLESFFWVLVWFVATHNPIAHTLGRIDEWQGSDLQAVHSAKHFFLKNMSVGEKLLRKRALQYDRMWKDTIEPLKRKFRNVENEGSYLEGLKTDYTFAHIEGDTDGMRELGEQVVRKSRERNALVSYEQFILYL